MTAATRRRLDKIEAKLKAATESIRISPEGKAHAEHIAKIFDLNPLYCIQAQARREEQEQKMSNGSPSKAAQAHHGARLEDDYWRAVKTLTLTGDIEIVVVRVLDVLTYSVLVEAHGASLLIPKHSIVFAAIDASKLDTKAGK